MSCHRALLPLLTGSLHSSFVLQLHEAFNAGMAEHLARSRDATASAVEELQVTSATAVSRVDAAVARLTTAAAAAAAPPLTLHPTQGSSVRAPQGDNGVTVVRPQAPHVSSPLRPAPVATRAAAATSTAPLVPYPNQEQPGLYNAGAPPSTHSGDTPAAAPPLGSRPQHSAPTNPPIETFHTALTLQAPLERLVPLCLSTPAATAATLSEEFRVCIVQQLITILLEPPRDPKEQLQLLEWSIACLKDVKELGNDDFRRTYEVVLTSAHDVVKAILNREEYRSAVHSKASVMGTVVLHCRAMLQ
jgi:hypothetical protein